MMPNSQKAHGSMTTILTPLVRITIKKEHFEASKEAKVSLPLDSAIHGKTEAFFR
jgi:hypothetical protein